MEVEKWAWLPEMADLLHDSAGAREEECWKDLTAFEIVNLSIIVKLAVHTDRMTSLTFSGRCFKHTRVRVDPYH